VKIFAALLITIVILASGFYVVRVHQDCVRATLAVHQVEYAYKLTPSQKIEITSIYIQGSDVCVDFIAEDARGARAAQRLIHLQAMHQVMTDVPFDYSGFCPNGHEVTSVRP
jgi:hypothetical protein